jgi:hypothetical protein
MGPTNAAIPPAALRADALTQLRRFVPDAQTRLLRALEAAVAYGCGVWRRVRPGSGGWEQRWQPALDDLTACILAWMKATAAWLQFDIQLKGYAFTAPFPSWREAQALAFLLWAGKCDCWRLKVTETDEPLDRRAAQRAARCLREHHLQAWNPADLTLNDFIARAVKGGKARHDTSGRKGFVSGAVEQGVFFCDLYREYDVRFGNVLGWQCSQHPDLLFEGSRCFLCDEENVATVFSLEHHKRTTVRRLLVRTPTGPYEYEEDAYWRCQNRDCGSYYSAYLPACPLGGHKRGRGAARSSVWVFGASSRPIMAEDSHGEVWEAFRQLEAMEQEVVRLIVMEELSKREAAKQLARSLKDVTQLLTIALAKLEKVLTSDKEVLR